MAQRCSDGHVSDLAVNENGETNYPNVGQVSEDLNCSNFGQVSKDLIIAGLTMLLEGS